MEKFEPAIIKYAKLLYKDEMEDIISEFQLTLLEAVQKITYFSDEGQCCMFLMRALKTRYLELYRISRKRFDHEQLLDEDCEVCITYNEYNHSELIEDFKHFISHYSTIQKKILISIFIEGKNNTEAAIENNVSRQYTNRLKNRLCEEMKIAYAA